MDTARINSVAVISTCGRSFVLDGTRSLTGSGVSAGKIEWGIDDAISDEVSRVLLRGNLRVRSANFDAEGFQKDLMTEGVFLKTTVSEAAQKNVAPADVDAYVIVTPIVWSPTASASDERQGIGLSRNLLGTIVLITECQMTVLDSHDFKQIASRPIAFAREEGGLQQALNGDLGPAIAALNDPLGVRPMRAITVASDLWADSVEHLTPTQKLELQDIVKLMLRNEVSATLKELRLSR